MKSFIFVCSLVKLSPVKVDFFYLQFVFLYLCGVHCFHICHIQFDLSPTNSVIETQQDSLTFVLTLLDNGRFFIFFAITINPCSCMTSYSVYHQINANTAVFFHNVVILCMCMMISFDVH